jgi:putative transposase
MPDHIHLFCAPAAWPIVSLPKWVRFWKSLATQSWPQPSHRPIWQRHFWDTQLRHGESYDEKWDYVMQNAVRAGLVLHPDDWAYQGELNILPW